MYDETIKKEKPLIDRVEEKIQMFIDRGGLGIAACDNCKKQRFGLEMHELIARSITQNNPLARVLSFQRQLCSLLCKSCHEEADTLVMQEALWTRNQRIYGEKFWEAFDRVQKEMQTEIPIYGKPRPE